MFKKHLIAALIAGAAVSTANAAEVNGYLFGNVGQAEVDLGNFESELQDLGLATSSDEKDTAFKVGAGVQLNPYVGVEFQYVDLGDFNVNATAAGAGNAKATFSTSGLGLNLVGTLPLDAFKLYGKVGYNKLETEAKVSTGGSTVFRDEEKENITSFALGATYALTPQFELGVEFERYQDLGSDHTTGGEEDADLLSLGLRYNF
ncbi:outer membrane autotransporter barrel domain-containing protein [Halopseudomonas xinjiangensis]|uniref:Outer membrane autotransporter barrel domain-containing protein n=1 Tax=Halopseudomonas xinjiangensis TaxID=487184 RepID=A0A1H1WG09_9GAMM|nr:porin [Halopseudomonas xinjiangensis]SDS96207.1 outer membrane autotransporter barrel domain-containing protein [Halopseudomonas xinjiangensis]